MHTRKLKLGKHKLGLLGLMLFLLMGIVGGAGAQTTLFEDSFSGTASTELSTHAPTLISTDAANASGWTWTLAPNIQGTTTGSAGAAPTTPITTLLTGTKTARSNSNTTFGPGFWLGSYYTANISTPTHNYQATMNVVIKDTTTGNVGISFQENASTGAGYTLVYNNNPAPTILLYRNSAYGNPASQILAIALTVAPVAGNTYTFKVIERPDRQNSAYPRFSVYGGIAGSSLALLSEGTDQGLTTQISGVFGLQTQVVAATYSATTAVQISAVNFSSLPALPALTAGVITQASQTGNALNLAVTNPASGFSSVQWYKSQVAGFTPGAGNIIAGATAFTLTDTTTGSGSWFYKAVETNGTGSVAALELPVNTTPVTLPSLVSTTAFTGRRSYEFIGDSIMYQTPTGGTETPPQRFRDFLVANVGGTATIVVTNDGTPFYTSNTWKSGSSALNTAISHANTNTATDVVYMIGTNDAQASAAFAPYVYQANISGTITALFAGVATLQRVWLEGPTFTVPLSGAFDQWTENSNYYQQQYDVAIGNLVNGTTIRRGTTLDFAFMSVNNVNNGTNNFQDTPGGIHPNIVGATSYGTLWAAPILADINATTVTAPPGTFPGTFSFTTLTVPVPLSWGAVASATAYRVYRDGVATPVYDGSSLAYTDSITPGSSHIYKVSAYNSAGESAQSSALPASTGGGVTKRRLQ